MLAVRTGVAESSWDWYVGQQWPRIAADLARERLVGTGQGYVQADGDELDYLRHLGLDHEGSGARVVYWHRSAATEVLRAIAADQKRQPPAEAPAFVVVLDDRDAYRIAFRRADGVYALHFRAHPTKEEAHEQMERMAAVAAQLE